MQTPNVTISTVQRIYGDDGYVYISGPTGTATFPAEADIEIDWKDWVPFVPVKK